MPSHLPRVPAVWVVVHPRTSVLPHARIVAACTQLGVVPDSWIRVEHAGLRPGDLYVLTEPPAPAIHTRAGNAVLL